MINYRLALGIVLLGSATACDDTQSRKELEELEPRWNTTRAQLVKFGTALPRPGKEATAPCTSKLQKPPDLNTLDERLLLAVVGKGPPPDLKNVWVQSFSRGQLVDLPTQARFAEWKQDPAPSHPLVLGRALSMLDQSNYLGVIRTTTLSEGKIEGKRLVQPGHWAGWLFVLDKTTGDIAVAISAEARQQ